ncbi:MAG: tetratricopeptide repeat protein [Polyangiaceae bacterium]|nr:tetratricopeptide repeat protein [Polyangiaceae bacterium]
MADRGTEEALTAAAPEPVPPAPAAAAVPAGGPAAPRAPWWRRAAGWVVRYFREQDPTFWIAFTPALAVAAILFVRSPASNYIFDEQEALLANPYVNGGKVPFWDVFKRDFWGLLPERTIGSYRPIPNIIWRLLWHLSKLPWLHHWVNVVLHAVNGALLASLAFAITRRRDASWLVGGAFVTSAVITEAVTGVVGIADVLGGLGVLLALAALRLPLWLMPAGVFAAVGFGLFSKESVLVAVPLVAFAALVWAPALHPGRPWRFARALFALTAAAGALVAYTYVRRKYFPITLPADLAEPLAASEPLGKRALHAFMRWFQQPRLPKDPINNPLVNADFPHRVAGALRVYFRGLGQVVFPWTLSGDYSFPQEPVPARLVFPESVLGGLALVAPPVASLGLWIRAWRNERRERRQGAAEPAAALWPGLLLAVGLMWVPIAYFPHSNIPVLLPTVRAERFWYLPVVGTSLVIGAAMALLVLRSGARRAVVIGIACFFGFQAVKSRWHAIDYTSDLTFWRATQRSAPNSAKAHLNYSVMIGAHNGDLPKRLEVNAEAKRLAPQWPMAHVYYGDTLCRMNRADEAWQHYKTGFELGPNDPNLLALGLQCLWDKKAVEPHNAELLDLADKHAGSWLAYFATEIVHRGEEHGGIEKKYRPRGYDEGPKKD